MGNEKVTSFRISEANDELLTSVAYVLRTSKAKILDAALAMYFKVYEQKYGPIEIVDLTQIKYNPALFDDDEYMINELEEIK